MSNILKLRKWLSIQDAAKYLTRALGEPVEPSDVLRFGLERQLTLSVDIVNRPRGCIGHMVSIEDAVVTKMPWFPTHPDLPTETRLGLPTADGKSIVQFEDQDVPVEGIWDLPMHGGERLDVESLYQQMAGLPETNMINLDGAFLVHPAGDPWIRLMEYFEPDAQARLTSEWGTRTYPGCTLPRGTTFVVRSEALAAFIDRFRKLSEKASVKEKGDGQWWEKYPIVEWANDIAARRHSRQEKLGKDHIAEEIARHIERAEIATGDKRKISGNRIKKVYLTNWKFVSPR